MLRPSNQTAEKIIELIQTLPENEQKLIVHKLSSQSIKETPKGTDSKDIYLKKIRRFQKYVDKNRFELPKGYKFDREEANQK